MTTAKRPLAALTVVALGWSVLMRSEHRHDSIDDYFLQGATQVLPRAFEMPEDPRRDRREVRFRNRSSDPSTGSDRTRKPRGAMTGRGPLIALAVFAVAVVVAVGSWGIGTTHPGANGASSATVADAAANAKVSASGAKKRSRKTRSSKSSAGKQRSTSSAGTNSTKTASAAAAKTAANGRSVASATAVRATASAFGGKVVVIDAGHQGRGDSSLEPIGPGASTMKPKVADGASGAYAPHDESEVNLEVALKLRDDLQARGVKVIMVRTSQNVNISNSQRAAIANKAHAALFIRLHCDGISDSSRHGFSTLIPGDNQWTGPIVSASAKAGHIVQNAALKATGARDAGVVSRNDLSGFNWSKVPTVLVEMGFMSNSAEDKALTSSSYQQKLATGLTNGVTQYLAGK